MINDAEALLKSIGDFVKENLNTRITAINTEKGDFNIDSITANDRHYRYGATLRDLPNHKFVNMTISGDIDADSNQEDILETVSILVEVVFDDPMNENTYFQSLRYMRAIYETLLQYEASEIGSGDLQLTRALPASVEVERKQLIISGVELSATLG